MSDRRGEHTIAQTLLETANWLTNALGGRTAWSSTVTVQGQNIAARFWYDGQHVNNAKEDAAEVALKHLTGSNPSSPSQSRTRW
jgi:hypothetical protein